MASKKEEERAPLAGQPAPDFTLPVAGGGDVSLSGLRGKKIVLYFYPRDDTPGCTTEAIDFTAQIGAFQDANAEVIGISKDTVEKHDKFRDKHGLQVILASDADGSTCEDYGVWVDKKMYGKVFQGIERSTFVIDTDGKVAHVWRKVRVPGHAEEVLGVVRDL